MIYQILNGPYINNEGRRIIFVGNSNANRKCISYARYLMSEHLGRELTENETVDHIDENKLNDCISNYQILTQSENASKTATIGCSTYNFYCPICGNSATKSLSHVRHNRKQGKAGPFCSKHCARMFQLNAIVAK